MRRRPCGARTWIGAEVTTTAYIKHSPNNLYLDHQQTVFHVATNCGMLPVQLCKLVITLLIQPQPELHGEIVFARAAYNAI